jgi:hypothetical protein
MAGHGGPVITAPSLGLEVGYALRVLRDSLLSGEPGYTFTGVRSRA